ncbi:calcium-binding protein E63-1 isoform X4 [Dendroctonus ponderosae]|nr:calcium-binding protein E63-1 isoform X4 [Dendroctonus ponderosae]XP_019771777.1 calcium-binding protein E63-1 isoform X4 [Dendroctonus ponderosae]XP_048522621.1 calcium-binding protein E63-1 isoform X4 [Dendroctonus ponderosae]
MLNNLGIDLKQNKVDELIRSASHAGKELIDENDFLKFVKQIQDLCDLRNSKDDDEQDLVAAFTVFDMDNDGYITKDELRIAMEMIGEENLPSCCRKELPLLKQPTRKTLGNKSVQGFLHQLPNYFHLKENHQFQTYKENLYGLSR